MQQVVPLITCLGLLATFAGNYAATAIGRAHYEKNYTEIFDVGHILIPQVSIPPYIFMLMEYLWLPFLFMAAPPTAAAAAMHVTIRFSALLALRAIANVVTVLPKDDKCDSNTWTLRNFLAGACYDKIFSGHIVFALLVSFSLIAFRIWPVWAGCVYSLTMAILMLVNRGHYTVDLVVGAALAYLSWRSPLFPTAPS